MANVTVDASAIITRGEKIVLRDSNDNVYVFVEDSNTLRVWKGNVSGEPTSFNEQDNANAPVASGGIFYGIAACIDSVGICHVMCYFDDTASMGSSDDIRYFTFHTSAASANQDTWQTNNEEIAALTRQDFEPNGAGRMSIQVDASDIPHAFWLEGISDMGTAWNTVHHSRRTGGTWDAKTIVTPASNNVQYNNFSAIIADPLSAVNADRPIVVANLSSQMDAYYGNALAATSWVEQRDVASGNGPRIGSNDNPSMAIDTNEKITVAYSEQTTNDMAVVEHLNANAWASWETRVIVDVLGAGQVCALAVDGTDRYILDRQGDADLHLFKSLNGGSWSEDTSDPDLPNVGTFAVARFKWSAKNDNSPKEMDYVFIDGTIILYNTFTVAVGAAIVQIADEILDHVDAGLAITGSVKIGIDVLEHVDSGIKVLGVVKIGSDILDHVETAISKVELRRIANEILDHVEGAIPVLALVRIGSDILDHIETAISKVELRRIVNEQLDHLEVAINIVSFSKIADEILDHIEVVLKVLGIVKTGDEQLDHVETAISKIVIIQIGSDILDHVESAISKVELRRIANEILDHVESVVKIIGLNKIANEILDHVETSIKIIGLNKIGSDILDHVETAISKVELRKIADEILDHVESAIAIIPTGLIKISNEVLDHVESAIQKIVAAALTVLFGRRSLDKQGFRSMDKG